MWKPPTGRWRAMRILLSEQNLPMKAKTHCKLVSRPEKGKLISFPRPELKPVSGAELDALAAILLPVLMENSDKLTPHPKFCECMYCLSERLPIQ